MKTVVIGAGSDLGIHIDGTSLGPTQLLNDLKGFYQGEILSFEQDEEIIKSRNLSDRRKNEFEIEKFNTILYNTVIEKMEEDYFPIVIGGDHSVSIPSALGSMKRNENIGIIWIAAHPCYNTFESTITGDINGLSLAAITGYKCNELRYYHEGGTIQPSRCVVVGAREIDEVEKDNIRYAGITVFSTEDIKERGVKAIMDEAFKIAGYKNNGVHVSFDLDVMDPEVAPGVSVPSLDGLNEDDAIAINEEVMKHIDEVVSYDLIEYNPLRDFNRKTEQIAVNLLAQIIKASTNKGKYKKNNY